MYKITLTNGTTETVVHDPSQGIFVLSAKIDKQSNMADVFSFDLDHNFDKTLLKPYTTLVTVYDDDEIIFRGRMTNDATNFYDTLQVDCEGVLSYLNDTQYPPFTWTSTPKDLLESVVDNHNSKVDTSKQLKIGTVTVTDPNDYLPRSSESYQSSMTIVKSKLVSSLGGYLIVRYEADGNYIDWLNRIEDVSTQDVELGSNLLDINIKKDESEIITVVIPKGATAEDGTVLDITSVNDGKNYLTNAEAVAAYGWIEGIVEFPDVTVASNLLTKARAYLEQKAHPTTTIDLSAVDLHMIDSSIEKFKLDQWIHVFSEFHGINDVFQLSKISLDLLNPQNNKITLGTVEQGLTSNTSTQIESIEGNLSTIQNTIVYQNVKIDGKLDANLFTAHEAYVDAIDARVATIEKAYITEADIEGLDAKYADIDFANITDAAVENLFTKSGMIENLIVSEGAITGTLVGVTIKGDLIEGGTVVADKLVVKGEDGLFYKLNTDGVSTTAEQTEYNSLNGSVITAKSITAEKVSVDDLVAFGATIGGFHITEDSLYSGVKSSATNTTRGVYMDDDGQFAVGDQTHYLRYFLDEDGTYKLIISVDSLGINIDGEPTTVEEMVDGAITSSEEKMASQIEATQSTIMTSVSETYTTKEEYQTLVESTTTQFEQTQNSFNFTFEEIREIVDSNKELSDAEWEQLKSYIRMEGGTMTFGASDSAVTLVLENDILGFYENGTRIAYFSNHKLYVKEIEAETSVGIGDWAWIQEANGSLSLRKVK